MHHLSTDQYADQITDQTHTVYLYSWRLLLFYEIEPVKVVAKEKAKPTGMSLYKDERFFPKWDELSNVEESIKAPLKSEAE